MGAERDRIAGFGRLEDGLLQAGDWYRWGPYVSERQWGTVREVLVNSWWEGLGFTLPRTRPGARWHTEIDSYDPASPAGAGPHNAGEQVTVSPRSVLVLRAAPPR